MTLHGKHLIAGRITGDEAEGFRAWDPAEGAPMDPSFCEAGAADVAAAAEAAEAAFAAYAATEPAHRADFLERIASEIEDLGEALVERASRESGLAAGRIRGERGRTAYQLRLFAAAVREGSWVDARIERPIPDRTPVPKPDLRRMNVPLGPVAVFGASNFPLAYSVAGGDTASALGAGCPVICKAHPAHPGTSEMVARAILRAAEAENMPDGVFSLVHGQGYEVGLGLVRHPLVQAVGFTGSLQGGRALFDAAAARPVPIPVYAEMGSVNPVFILPSALEKGPEALAEKLAGSILLGVGQFCTNPGLAFGVAGEAMETFAQALSEHIRRGEPATMLHRGIRDRFCAGTDRLGAAQGVRRVAVAERAADPERTEAGGMLFRTDAQTFLANDLLAEEVFGPSSLVVVARDMAELEEVAHSLKGQLTASIHGDAEEIARHDGLVRALRRVAGRFIFNGFPTGVEVCSAMHHGGPYPATTDVRTGAVGDAALLRFVRPAAWQNFPSSLLPAELRDRNERGIRRLVDGAYSTGDAG